MFTAADDEREFIQRRVVLYARASLVMLAIFAVLDWVTYPWASEMVSGFDLRSAQIRGIVIEAAVLAMLAGTGWLAGRGRPSVMRLYVLDAAATLLLGAALAGLAHDAPLIPLPVELLLFLGIISFLVLHTALVPAPAPRTFVLHLLACVPVFVVALDRMYRMEPTPLWMQASVVGIGTWSIVFAAVAATVSHLLHGLRVRVREVARLGQYQLEAKIGEGAMGIVYRARHALLRRPTAVKVLPTERAGERTIGRFEREVQSTSLLTHPNTVAIYDFGRTPEGIFFYAMEFLEGVNLAQAVEMSGPMPAARVVHLLKQCAGALSEAHQLGLVHRDVKPPNILLCRRGGVADTAKVVDFGLVKNTQHLRDPELSHDNALLGTPLYISPEALTDPDGVDARSDLYSLGATAWFLLTGRPPFMGSLVEVCSQHLSQPPDAPSAHAASAVPNEVDGILLKLLAKSPAGRFQSAAELVEALDALPLTWTQRDAQAWWHQHEVTIRQRAQGTALADRVLTVALERS